MFKEENPKLYCRPRDCDDTGKPGWDSLVMDCAAALASAFCFACSGIHMLEEEFPEMMVSGGGAFPKTGIFAVLAVIILLFMVPGRRSLLWRRVFAGLALPVAGVAAGWIWTLHGKALASGSVHAAGLVIAAVNYQYKLNFSLPQGQAGSCPGAVMWICGIVLALLLYGACLCRRRWLVMLFPLLILGLGLLAGRAPGFQGITEGFVGAMFCRAGGWESARAARGKSNGSFWKRRPWAARGMAWAFLVLLAFILPYGISRCFSDVAERLAESGERAVAVQRKMEEALERNIQQMSFGSVDAAKENVNNRTPKYREQEILRVMLPEKPGHNLYFRGFYGGEYARGGWNSNRDILQGSLAGQGWEEETAARWMSGKQSVWGDEPGERAGFPPDCTLQFLRRGTTVYVPYFLTAEDPGGALRYGGEYLVRKEKSLDQIRFCRAAGGFAADFGGIEDGIEEWYSVYVRDNYCRGSAAVPSAVRIAEEMREQYSGSYSRVFTEEDIPAFVDDPSGFELYEAIQTEDLESGDTERRNAAMLQFANRVSAYLSSGVYSQELGKVPDGTDVVEYFLAESKTGYCVHYASAGVLILQAMGIPARYASGYVAAGADFTKEAGQYVLDLKDSAAHAWAEIYLEGVGWVPVEMTPGYGDEQPDVQDGQMTLRRTPEDGEDKESPLQPAEGASNILSDKEQPEDPMQLTGTKPPENPVRPGGAGSSEDFLKPQVPNGSGEPGSDRTAQGAEGAKTAGTINRAILPAVAAVACVLAALVFVLHLFSAKKKKRMRALSSDIRTKQNRRAILFMNRILYRQVRAKKRKWFALLSDEEYLYLLIRTFPQRDKREWERFISVARKARFSRSEITDEEVQAAYSAFARR